MSSDSHASDPHRGLAIECRGLSKVFRDFWLRPRVTAVDDVDLTVGAGEVFGLLGPNGSGKSTCIKMILGLLFPTRGSIRVLGADPTDVKVKARIGYLPEESHLYPFLNAWETLDYYGRLLHIDRDTRRRRSEELLAMVGLEGSQQRAVGEYSKGMQRRIGLATALINDPDLLILDEPTNGLDPIGTRQVKDLVLELRRRGKTVLVTSHLLADVEEVCSRLAILYGGKIRRTGTVGELLTQDDGQVIRTESLDEATLGRLRRLLREEGKELHAVETPRHHLEELFLEIVEQARREGAVTSGARDGDGTASFLSATEKPSRDS